MQAESIRLCRKEAGHKAFSRDLYRSLVQAKVLGSVSGLPDKFGSTALSKTRHN